ncbi:hypothetical protein [Paenisporosarcina sp. OV554]|uniref:hypothetical protein n=1 Tax=Paenisporosarcina sp. OV554 TaxID=2135694 RepID=UPI00130497E5|nr:hypothetical protein [Paenisporosarcina sp. OV554]
MRCLIDYSAFNKNGDVQQRWMSLTIQLYHYGDLSIRGSVSTMSGFLSSIRGFMSTMRETID